MLITLRGLGKSDDSQITIGLYIQLTDIKNYEKNPIKSLLNNSPPLVEAQVPVEDMVVDQEVQDQSRCAKSMAMDSEKVEDPLSIDGNCLSDMVFGTVAMVSGSDFRILACLHCICRSDHVGDFYDT